jgi:hypothetical protein
MQRTRALGRLVAGIAVVAVALTGCSGGDDDTTTTTTADEPAPQFGSSMGIEAGDVADVAALGDGPAEGASWQVPVGLSVCGRFLEMPAGTEVAGVTSGPATTTVTGSGGDAPTLSDLAASAGIDLAAGRLTLPEDIVPPELEGTDPPIRVAGQTFATGDECIDSTGEVQVWVYSEDARASGDGILVVTQDLGNVPFSQEGMAIVIAFAPESSLPTLPPSALGG